MTLPRQIKRHVTGEEVVEKSVTMCEKRGDKFYHTQYHDPNTYNKDTLYKIFSITDKNNRVERSTTDFVPIKDALDDINYLIDIANNNPERAIVRWGTFLFNNQKEFEKRFHGFCVIPPRKNTPKKCAPTVKVNVRKMF